jgi:hypothetical protein
MPRHPQTATEDLCWPFALQHLSGSIKMDALKSQLDELSIPLEDTIVVE